MKQKLIVITGASSGIGAVCAKSFSQAGYYVLLLARRLQPMLDLQLPNATCKSVDVTDINAVKNAINEVDLQTYDIDCLVNNAGSVLAGHFSDTDIEEESAMIDVNLKGILNCTKVIAPIMQQQEQGTIINVSSLADRLFSLGVVAVYAATKAAVSQLTQSMHATYKDDNIRCCNIAPGDVESSIWDGKDASLVRDPDTMPLPSEELAKAILWVYQLPQQVCIRDLVITHTSSST